MGDTGGSKSGGSTATGPGGRLASLGKGAKWLGGIVVVAVVGALTPIVIGSFKSPEEIEADFKKVSIANPMTLDEYARRQRGVAVAALPGGAPTMRLVAYVADATSAEAPQDDVPEDVPPPSPVPEVSPEADTPTTPDDLTPDETTTNPSAEEPEDGPGTPPPPPPLDPKSKLQPGDTVKAQRDPLIPLELEQKEIVKLREGMTTALQAPGVPDDLDVPASCEANPGDDDCGLASQLGLADEEGKPKNVSTEKIAKRLIEVFKGTRTRRVSAEPGKPARRELLGVMVSYTLKLTGLRGSRAGIRWSLLSAGKNSVRDPWLVNRQVSVLAGKANTYTGGGKFWVPMPEERGPFYIRIEAADSDGQELNFFETDHFR